MDTWRIRRKYVINTYIEYTVYRVGTNTIEYKQWIHTTLPSAIHVHQHANHGFNCCLRCPRPLRGAEHMLNSKFTNVNTQKFNLRLGDMYFLVEFMVLGMYWVSIELVLSQYFRWICLGSRLDDKGLKWLSKVAPFLTKLVKSMELLVRDSSYAYPLAKYVW